MTRFLAFLNRESNGLHQAAFLLASASIGAKLLAILRDRLLASNFGADRVLDIYYASFRLPDLLYVFSLFLVSATALIPIILGKKRQSVKESRQFLNGVFTTFFFLMIFLALVSFFLTPWFMRVITPGFSEEDRGTLVDFSRILLFSPFLLGLSNLVSSILQSFNRFFVYALSGILYNAGIIFGLLVLYPRFGLNGVVCGVVFGALLHLSVQLPTLLHLGYFPAFSFKIPFREIKNVVFLSLPRALGLTLHQLVLLAITALASLLAAGSIAVFNLASNLQAIPLGIVALSYSVAAFPSLAESHIKNEKEKFFSLVLSSFRHILFWLLPISVLFIVLRAQIIRVTLGAGVFTWTDTRLTAAAFGLFVLSLFAQGLILLLVRAFYASGDTKTPLVINLISSLAIIVIAIVLLLGFKYSAFLLTGFSVFLKVKDLVGVPVLALPLAYSLGTILNFFLILIFFKRRFGNVFSGVKKSIAQILFGSLMMGLVAYIGLKIFDDFFVLDTFRGVFMQGFLAGVLALIVGFLFFRYVNNEEFDELSASLKKKFFRKPAVEPEPEGLQ